MKSFAKKLFFFSAVRCTGQEHCGLTEVKQSSLDAGQLFCFGLAFVVCFFF